jgi:hypothetical protein
VDFMGGHLLADRTARTQGVSKTGLLITARRHHGKARRLDLADRSFTVPTRRSFHRGFSFRAGLGLWQRGEPSQRRRARLGRD